MDLNLYVGRKYDSGEENPLKQKMRNQSENWAPEVFFFCFPVLGYVKSTKCIFVFSIQKENAYLYDCW